jgi:23S rRNA (guanosine2251-2'-O)-methyltransferase
MIAFSTHSQEKNKLPMKDLLIYGIHPVEEALQKGKPMGKILVKKDAQSESLRRLKHNLRSQGVAFQEVPEEALYKHTAQNHQGVVAWLSPVGFLSIEEMVAQTAEKQNAPLLLLLDRITDVRNFGAIARTAECAGVHGIIFPEGESAALNADAIKTSSGALLTIPLCRVRHLADAVMYLNDSDFQTIALTEKATPLLYESTLTPPTALIVGSEDKGISSQVLRVASAQARLPILGNIGSLNVSVACGAALFEVVRQRMKESK